MKSTTLDDKTEKVGITLPISLVKQVDKMRARNVGYIDLIWLNDFTNSHCLHFEGYIAAIG